MNARCLFLIAALVEMSIGALAQQPRTRLFEVNLSPYGMRLLNEVEASLGPLRENVQEGLLTLSGMNGLSGIDDQGHPFVTIDRAHIRNERLILHELYHLKLAKAGFSWWGSESANTEVQAIVKRYELMFSALLFSPIAHTRLFPREVRSDDDGPNSKEGLQSLAPSRSMRRAAASDTVGRTMALFDVMLEVRNRKLVRKTVAEFRKAGWIAEADAAANMVDIVRTAILETPEQMGELFARLLGLLFKDRLIFQADGIKTQCKGVTCCPTIMTKILPAAVSTSGHESFYLVPAARLY